MSKLTIYLIDVPIDSWVKEPDPKTVPDHRSLSRVIAPSQCEHVAVNYCRFL
jgi:hypothetical protein